MTGAENWLDLCDNSIGVWTGFYDYLKDFYNKAGKIFSTENQKGVAGLGIAGNVVGLVGDLFGAADTISNTENIGIAGTTGEILGASDKVIDIWGSVEKLCHVGDSATNITTKSGLYSPLSFYTAAAKAIFLPEVRLLPAMKNMLPMDHGLPAMLRLPGSKRE